MKIKNLYIEESILGDTSAKKIEQKFKFENKIICKNYKEVFNPKNQNFRIQKETISVILAKKNNNLILRAPKNFSIGIPNNFYFSHMLNCIYDCNYCFLQGMFNSAYFVIFINFEDFNSEIKRILSTSNQKTCFFSGYDCDSLAVDKITGFIDFFVKKFKKYENGILEIRSKSTKIDSLLKFSPSTNIIPAFSLNSEKTIAIHERNTPKLQNRLNAIKKLQNHGWNIGIRLDPFIWSESKDLLPFFFIKIFKNLILNKIHSVTIGNFRMTNSYLKKMSKINSKDPFILQQFILQNFKNDLKEKQLFELEKIKKSVAKFVCESKIFIN